MIKLNGVANALRTLHNPADFRMPSSWLGASLCARRSGGSAARKTDALEVPVIRAAAAAEHIDLRVLAQQITVLATKLDRIAGVEVRRIVQLLVAAPRRISADAANPCRPPLLRR